MKSECQKSKAAKMASMGLSGSKPRKAYAFGGSVMSDMDEDDMPSSPSMGWSNPDTAVEGDMASIKRMDRPRRGSTTVNITIAAPNPPAPGPQMAPAEVIPPPPVPQPGVLPPPPMPGGPGPMPGMKLGGRVGMSRY